MIKLIFLRFGLRCLMLLPGLFLFSCQVTKPPKHNLIVFEPVADKVLPILPNQDLAGFYSFAQLVQEKDSSILIVTDNKSGTIYRYDFKNEKLINAVTPSQTEGFKAVFNTRKRKYFISDVAYINSDSIFIRYHLLYFNFAEKADSTLMLLDWKGNVKNIYSLKGVPVPATENGKINKDTALFFTSVADGKPYVGNQKVYLLPMERWADTAPGDTLFEQKRTTVGGHLDLTFEKGKYIPHQVLFPPVPIGQHYPRSFGVPIALQHHNLVLYAFAYTDQVFLYNYTKGKAGKEIKIGSYLFGQVPPTSLPVYTQTASGMEKDLPTDDLHLPKYGRIFYDPYRQHFYRFIRQAPRAGAPSSEVNNPIYTVVLLDKNFTKIGEGVFPTELGKGAYREPIFTKEGVYFWNREATELQDNKVVFTLFKVRAEADKDHLKLRKAVEQAQNQYKKYSQDDGLANYLSQEFKLGSGEHKILLVPVESSCITCLNDFFDQYRQGKLSKATKIILIGSSQKSINQRLAKEGINEKAPDLLYDPGNKFLLYLPAWVNPRWVIFNNGEVEKDFILSPAEVKKLPNLTRN